MSDLSRHIIQAFEHQPLRIGEEGFKKNHFEALVKYNEKHKNQFFVIGHKKITFTNYVGVIQIKGLTIEILPKADLVSNIEAKEKWRNALLTMLHECKQIKLESLTNAYLRLKSSSLLDLYFEAFLNEVEKLVHQGLSKKYRKCRNNLTSLKGKIIFRDQITENYIHRERFFSEYQTYDRNFLINQILLMALLILKSITQNPEFLRRAAYLLLHFEGIASPGFLSEVTFQNINFARNTERYKEAIKLARLIILKYSPDLRGGDEDILAIIFDMNKLFENFIYRKLKKLEKSHSDIEVREQVRKKFWETRGIRPDIVINLKGETIVLDTKWKILREPIPSDDDLKQIFVYNLHYNSDRGILLYPQVKNLDEVKKPYHLFRFDDNQKSCHVAFVELFDDHNKIISNLGENIFVNILQGKFSSDLRN
jgi:5-methylcytosine-specific restriction enzyme subunit McrC